MFGYLLTSCSHSRDRLLEEGLRRVLVLLGLLDGGDVADLAQREEDLPGARVERVLRQEALRTPPARRRSAFGRDEVHACLERRVDDAPLRVRPVRAVGERAHVALEALHGLRVLLLPEADPADAVDGQLASLLPELERGFPEVGVLLVGGVGGGEDEREELLVGGDGLVRAPVLPVGLGDVPGGGDRPGIRTDAGRGRSARPSPRAPGRSQSGSGP